MHDYLVVTLIGCATALATGLGALPVAAIGHRITHWWPLLWGLTAGLMGTVSVTGLLIPATQEGSAPTVVLGLAVGVTFLLATRWLLNRRREKLDGQLDALNPRSLWHRSSTGSAASSILVFAVLFAHSLPEGFAIGTAYASSTAGLALYVVLAIALQNIPEGTALAIPMRSAGFSVRSTFWSAVLTSVPQPIGALIAFALVEEVTSLLSFSFAFAAGAMLSLTVVELLPQALKGKEWPWGLLGAVIGVLFMLGFGLVLGVEV